MLRGAWIRNAFGTGFLDCLQQNGALLRGRDFRRHLNSDVENALPLGGSRRFAASNYLILRHSKTEMLMTLTVR